MIKLYQFPPGWGLPSYSPFCLKLETWLRLTALPYEVVDEPDPRKGPKAKLPYIDDGGTVLGDSLLIIDYLSAKYAVDLDTGLEPRRRGLAQALGHLFEDGLYWTGIVYPRWAIEANWQIVKPEYFAALPAPLRPLIAALARRSTLGSLKGQGVGRHSAVEVAAMGCRDIAAVASLLGEQDFMLGDQPSGIDATAYAFLAAILAVPIETPVRQRLQQSENLTAYCRRLRERCFPD